MFRAVALPAWALLWGSGDPAVPAAPHWDGREGGSWAQLEPNLIPQPVLGNPWIVARLSWVGCGKNGLLGDGKTPWCWECPHPCPIGRPFPVSLALWGRQVQSEGGEQSWRAGNPKSQCVCGAVIPWPMEPEWLGLSIPGLRTGWGCSVPPQPRVIQRCVQNSLRVPGQRSHCTLEGQPAGIFPSFPQQFHSQKLP